jgi:mono/diheme cytochrome c family protein
MLLPLLLLACTSGPATDALPPAVQQAMAQDLPDDLAAGRVAFRSHCASCHGRDAAGDGPAATALGAEAGALPIVSRDPDRIRRVLRNGLPGTAMQAFDLPEEQREAVVAWLASLPPPGAAQSE